MTEIISEFNEVSHEFEALFFDVWGCLHNGVRPYVAAVRSLRKFVADGGKVVLLTNSPRPNPDVEIQIATIGVPRDSWNILVTSGDAARAALFAGQVGRSVYHIGTQEELGFFKPDESSEQIENGIEHVELEAAEGLVCTRPFQDSVDQTKDYLPILETALRRKLPMLCANPDLFVDRGFNRVICAGAIAKEYSDMGGKVLLFGKPRSAIYELARRRLEKFEPGIPTEKILCVGDGIATDILGAARNGYPSLFVSGGLAARETGTEDGPEPAKLDQYLYRSGLDPDFTIGRFR